MEQTKAHRKASEVWLMQDLNRIQNCASNHIYSAGSTKEAKKKITFFFLQNEMSHC